MTGRVKYVDLHFVALQRYCSPIGVRFGRLVLFNKLNYKIEQLYNFFCLIGLTKKILFNLHRRTCIARWGTICQHHRRRLASASKTWPLQQSFWHNLLLLVYMYFPRRHFFSVSQLFVRVYWWMRKRTLFVTLNSPKKMKK